VNVVVIESSLVFSGRVGRRNVTCARSTAQETAHLTCTDALRVAVTMHRRSEWRRSATLNQIRGVRMKWPARRVLRASRGPGRQEDPRRGAETASAGRAQTQPPSAPAARYRRRPGAAGVAPGGVRQLRAARRPGGPRCLRGVRARAAAPRADPPRHLRDPVEPLVRSPRPPAARRPALGRPYATTSSPG
jgi:hypothetical protein